MSAEELKLLTDQAHPKIKARIVALGNIMYNKYLKARRNQGGGEFWSLVVDMAAIRVIEARANSYSREPTGIDLIKAYSQILIGREKQIAVIPPEAIISCLSDKIKASVKGLRAPVYIADGGIYGIGNRLSSFFNN